MADADEDAARGRSVEATQIETDLSDETQDFRLLNHLSLYVRERSCHNATLALLYTTARR